MSIAEGWIGSSDENCDPKTTAQGQKTAKKFERGSHGSNVFSVTIFPLDLGIYNMPL
jgi:hypothetical protein